VFDVLVDKVSRKGVDARVICPLEGTDGRLVSAIASRVRLLSGHEASRSMLIVDDKKCFVVAERDAGDQYGGFMLHTNSPPAVRSFNSLFDIQWRELSLIDSLLQMGKQRDEFISVAAHELRNPITPIMLFVDGLKEEFGDRPEIAGIMRNTKRLQRLLQDVLDSAKVDNKNLVLKKTQFNLSNLLREACADAQNQARSKEVSIVLEQEKDVVMVVADPARISQVVYNLLDNALKFTARGTITVSTRSDGKKVEVAVRDEGSGIDAKVLPKLFGKFVTASDTGTGIGLYLCKAIVEAHGGRIRGANNNPGKGSTFSFTLPLT
jgi:signal transduction histidine kinase